MTNSLATVKSDPEKIRSRAVANSPNDADVAKSLDYSELKERISREYNILILGVNDLLIQTKTR